jgi:hypothetical protein
VRKLRFFEPRQYVSIDYARQDLLVIRLDGGVAAEGAAPNLLASLPPHIAAMIPPQLATALAAGKVDPALIAQFAASAKIDPAVVAAFMAQTGPAPGLTFAKPEVTPGEPLRLEIESFLDSVRTRREPRVTARQGRNALELALEIQASMAAHAHRAGLDDFFEAGNNR